MVERASAGAPEVRTLLGALSIPVGRELRPGVTLVDAGRAGERRMQDVVVQLGAQYSPVVLAKRSPLRVVALPRVVFALHADSKLAAVPSFIATAAVETRAGVYRADIPAGSDPWESLRWAALLATNPAVAWAVPDCVREVIRPYLPNDSGGLWHVRNTNSPPWTNDSSMASAWNTTLGDPKVVIAIMDDGVDILHPDLSTNIWINPGEIPDDRIDNDGNGYTDDVHGWNFFAGTNDVTPRDTIDNHGTALAGLAAGRGDNGIGVVGTCPFCEILSVKILQGEDAVADSEWASAVLYAAKYARVINLSIGTSGALEEQLVDAFNQVSTGCLVFASTGNGADYGLYPTNCSGNAETWGWMYHSEAVSSPGSHVFRWVYEKDVIESMPSDCAWLDGVSLPDGRFLAFTNNALPTGWTTGGDASWFPSSESTDHVVSGSFSMRSGEITNSQNSWLQVVATGTGTVSFYYQCFGERSCWGGTLYDFDRLTFAVDGVTNYWDTNEDPGSFGEDYTGLEFPAALTSVVAVGASTIEGYRAAYSCFGTNLSVVAPSSGATWEIPVRTTDRQGAAGYDPGDYYDLFGGTSASTPLAAGIAALLWGANPDLTPGDVRRILQQSARKIGTVPYVDGCNTRYGYGQVDAAAAMRLLLSNMPPRIARIRYGTNAVQFAALGIETGRVYHVDAASAVVSNGAWNWQSLAPSNATGAPVFGTNWTPYFSVGSTTQVFRIGK